MSNKKFIWTISISRFFALRCYLAVISVYGSVVGIRHHNRQSKRNYKNNKLDLWKHLSYAQQYRLHIVMCFWSFFYHHHLMLWRSRCALVRHEYDPIVSFYFSLSPFFSFPSFFIIIVNFLSLLKMNNKIIENNYVHHISPRLHRTSSIMNTRWIQCTNNGTRIIEVPLSTRKWWL